MKITAIVVSLLAASASVAQSPEDGMFHAGGDATDFRASALIGMPLYVTTDDVSAAQYQNVPESWREAGIVDDVVVRRETGDGAFLVRLSEPGDEEARHVALRIAAVRFPFDGTTQDDLTDVFLVVTAPEGALDTAAAYRPATAVSAGEAAVSSEPRSDGDMPGQADPALVVRQGYQPVPREAVTAALVEGVDVYDAEDQPVGQVAGVAVDEQGAVREVVVALTGGLGLGRTEVTLPVEDLVVLRRQDAATVRIYLPVTAAELGQTDP